MQAKKNDQSQFKLEVPRQFELPNILIRGLWYLVFWTVITVSLSVGLLVHREGWIPPDIYPLTGKYGIFSGWGAHIILVFSVANLLMQFLRLRATIVGDAKSQRLASITGTGIAATALVGSLAAVVAFYGLVAHAWRHGEASTASYITSASIGVALVASLFLATYLTRKRVRHIAPDDDVAFGSLVTTFSILVGLPAAALFGFSLAFIAMLLLERTTVSVEPVRAVLNARPTLFVGLMTGVFLAMSGIVHACRWALRPRTSPVFFLSMLGTGCAIVLVKFAFIGWVISNGP